MVKKDSKFYIELVVVTILSLVAANAWIRWVTSTLNYYFPGNLFIDFFMALVATIIAVEVLDVSFVDDKEEYEEVDDNECVRSKLYRMKKYKKSNFKL